MYTGLHKKYPLFLSDFNETLIFSNIKFHENPSSGIRLAPRGRTDWQAAMTQLIFAFCNFAKALKTQCLYKMLICRCRWNMWAVCFRTRHLNAVQNHNKRLVSHSQMPEVSSQSWLNRSLRALTCQPAIGDTDTTVTSSTCYGCDPLFLPLRKE
jgi:hypothetical protein